MLNGIINLNVQQQFSSNSIPPALGPILPRTKVPGSRYGEIEKTSHNATIYKSYNEDITAQYGIVVPSNTSPTSSIELYVLEVDYGYEVDGSEAFSKYYQRFYPISSVIRTATIKCVARNEYEYEDFAWWVRKAQTDMSKGLVGTMGIYVPAAGINASGFIPTFPFKLGAAAGESVNPVPIAIEFQFEFLITQDNTDTDNPSFSTILSDTTSYTVWNIGQQGWFPSSSTQVANVWKSYTDGLNWANANSISNGNGISNRVS